VVRSGLEGDRGLPTRLTGTSVQGGLTWLEGSRGPLGRVFELSGEEACSGLRVRAGHRIRGAEGQALEGRKPESNGCSVRGNSGGVRTDSQGEERFEAGEAGGKKPLRCSGSRATGKQALCLPKGDP